MISWIEVHKDFCLVVAALSAAVVGPFAAVFVGLVSSKRQARTLLEATRMQILAGAFREYRQQNIEKLREELAAELFYVSQLRFGQQKLGMDNPNVVQMVEEAQARKIRIGLLVAASSDRWKECFGAEEQLVKRIRGMRPREVWSPEENAAFDREIDRLGTLSVKVVEGELQAIVGKE